MGSDPPVGKTEIYVVDYFEGTIGKLIAVGGYTEDTNLNTAAVAFITVFRDDGTNYIGRYLSFNTQQKALTNV